MSDIIRFPQFMQARAQSVSDLTEAQLAADDVKMSDLYDQAVEMSVQDEAAGEADANISFLQQSGDLAAPVVGWSNQELADLYRTQRILAQAGVTTEVDRGITDEGDPWFVFLDGQGEVLVHFSRFDGVYLVSSQLQEAPIKGESLQDLVTQFSNRVRPVEEAAPNVVSMARRHREVVFIHPAAALAALVWSVYLMSDELIAATPMIAAGAAEGAGHTPLDKAKGSALASSIKALNAPISDTQESQPAAFDPEVAKQAMASASSREGLMMGLSGQGIKAVGVSLSLVALASGLPLPASTAAEIVDDTVTPEKLSLEKLSAALAQVKAEEKALLLASEAAQLEQREIDATVRPPENELETALTIDSEAGTSVGVQLANPAHAAQTEGFSGHTSVTLANIVVREDAPAPAEETTEVAMEAKPAPSSHSTAKVQEVSFLMSFDAAFKSFEITSLERIAQDELFKLLNGGVAVKAPDLLEAPVLAAPVEVALQFEAFDQEARVYLDFLLQTYNNVKVVNLPTEIIFIHMDAFEGKSPSTEIYAKSWSFDDGGTISTIGLKSDMIEFDLIA